MKTFCEMAAKIIIPTLRALLALTLIDKYNMTQVEVAKKLGTSQPAISYYVHSRRGRIALSILKNNREVMELIEETAMDIYEGREHVDVASRLCTICEMIRKNERLVKDILSLFTR